MVTISIRTSCEVCTCAVDGKATFSVLIGRYGVVNSAITLATVHILRCLYISQFLTFAHGFRHGSNGNYSISVDAGGYKFTGEISNFPTRNNSTGDIDDGGGIGYNTQVVAKPTNGTENGINGTLVKTANVTGDLITRFAATGCYR